VDAIGILQVMWLLKKRPEILDHLENADKPTVQQLRRVGLVEMRLAGED